MTNNETTDKIKSLVDALPAIYKRIPVLEDVVLVIAGLKSATDMTFNGEQYDEEEFKILQKIFEGFGLRVAQKQTRFEHISEKRVTLEGRQIIIFNPEKLKAETKDTPLAPPYDGQQDIFDYIQEAEGATFDPDEVYGMIYSFPKSAIADYIKKRNTGKRLEELPNYKTIATFGETYIVENMTDEVKDREAAKQTLFDDLIENTELQAIMYSEDVTESHVEWEQRERKYIDDMRRKAVERSRSMPYLR